MIEIKINKAGGPEIIKTETGPSLFDILRQNGYSVYAPCGGKGTCGKCLVTIAGKGSVLSCKYFPQENIEVILPKTKEARILVNQTKFLEDCPFNPSHHPVSSPSYGVAIDIGTTTVVLYFLNMESGEIEEISPLLNPQRHYGADVITRINYCQEHGPGLNELQQSIIGAINASLDSFGKKKKISSGNFEKIIVAGNTTMLHLLLGVNPVSIALAPFRPVFTEKQILKGSSTGFHISSEADVVTLPCLSAYVGADIVAGLAAIKSPHKNYLFLDIGTNGEMALVSDGEIVSCATAAGPAFEGGNISCGMGAVIGAIAGFSGPDQYQVIGNTPPKGICGSAIIDIVAWLVKNDRVDETGELKETFIIHPENNIQVVQQDIREIQLAKSAIYSGIKILMAQTGLTFDDIDALYLAGGFGNYINIPSAIQIGLLPYKLRKVTFAVGNSAGIGTLQYLKSEAFEKKAHTIFQTARYIELSNVDEFAMEFAINMNFTKNF
ncbi:MAG: ASKHA domain-containing protein [Prolixibacteraceae bacterium]|jgi:uncharacterized 2Fe-2S/4Fe-4S cluster protein (DUF4445 family)|nr:ASKHA domain-containing protein [Prolixibacteraceae bacterium]